MIQRLPLEPSIGNYTFGTNLEGVQYVINVRWNGRDEAWYFDLLAADETPIRCGIKITLGYPLGARSAHDDLPDALFLASDLAGQGEDANFNDLGTRLVLDYAPFDDLGL